MTRKKNRPAQKNHGGQGRRNDRIEARTQREERFAQKDGRASSSSASSSSASSPRAGAAGGGKGRRIGRAPWEQHKDAPPKPAPRPSFVSPPPAPLAKALAPEACVYGRHAVEATLRHQPQRGLKLFHTDHKDLLPLVQLAEQRGIPTSQVDVATVDALAGGREFAVAQGVVLSCSEFPYASVFDFDKAPDLTLVLDGVEDPRNLGAAVRAAYALGAGLVVVPHDRAAAPTASAIKASAGALCRVPFAREVNLRRALELLQEKGAWVVGAEADGEAPPWSLDLTGPTVIVIGGEDRGLRRLTREACDHVTAIPMSATDMSLNAADAATLLLYEVLRQRRTAGAAPTTKKKTAPKKIAPKTSPTEASAATRMAAPIAAKPAKTTATTATKTTAKTATKTAKRTQTKPA